MHVVGAATAVLSASASASASVAAAVAAAVVAAAVLAEALSFLMLMAAKVVVVLLCLIETHCVEQGALTATNQPQRVA